MKKIFFILFVVLIASGPAFCEPFDFAQGKPLTLQESTKIALSKNHDIQAAKRRVIASEGRLGQARAGFLPNLKLEAFYGKTYEKPITYSIARVGSFSTTPDETADLSSYNASLVQPLYAGGRIVNSYAVADLELKSAKEDLRAVTQAVEFKVTEAYFNVLRTEKLYELAQGTKELNLKHLSQAKAMLKAGTATKTDLLRAELEVAKSEEGLLSAQKNLELAKALFNSILSKNLDEDVILTYEEIKPEAVAIPNYPEILNGAYKNSPDYLSFKLKKEISKKNISLAQSGSRPSLSLVGTYGGNYTNYPNSSTSYDISSWSAVLSGSWTFFDGFSTPEKVKEAKANLEELASKEESLRMAIAIDVKDANLSLNTVLEEIKAAQKTLSLAKENHRIADLKYSSGVGTNIEVVDAMTALSEASVNYLRAKYDYEIAKARVNKVVGKKIF